MSSPVFLVTERALQVRAALRIAKVVEEANKLPTSPPISGGTQIKQFTEARLRLTQSLGEHLPLRAFPAVLMLQASVSHSPCAWNGPCNKAIASHCSGLADHMSARLHLYTGRDEHLAVGESRVFGRAHTGGPQPQPSTVSRWERRRCCFRPCHCRLERTGLHLVSCAGTSFGWSANAAALQSQASVPSTPPRLCWPAAEPCSSAKVGFTRSVLGAVPAVHATARSSSHRRQHADQLGARLPVWLVVVQGRHVP
jgi:hypothetical protein